jgi:hypothetical protein
MERQNHKIGVLHQRENLTPLNFFKSPYHAYYVKANGSATTKKIFPNKNPLVAEGILYKALMVLKALFQLDGRLGSYIRIGRFSG